MCRKIHLVDCGQHFKKVMDWTGTGKEGKEMSASTVGHKNTDGKMLTPSGFVCTGLQCKMYLFM